MILLTLRPADRAGYLDAVPHTYSDAGREITRAMPGVRWVRDRRSPNGRGYYRGPAEAVEILARTLAAARIAKIDRPAPDGYVTEACHWMPNEPALREYQRVGARWLVSQLRASGGAILADEMGLGKTPQAIVAACALAPPDRMAHVLVAAPAIVVPHWRNLIVQWSRSAAVGWHLLSYEGLVTASRGGSKKIAPLADRYDTVIFDEAHYIANSKSQRGKAAAAVRARCDYAIALTGTPIPTRVRDLWHPLEVVHPGRWGSWFSFTARYADGRYEEIPAIEKSVWNADGASHLDELRERLGAVMLRRTKAEVGHELPLRTRVTLEVEMPAAARRDFMRAAATLDGADGVASLLSRVESHKVAAAIELARDVIASGSRPLILTTRHATAETIAYALGCPCAHGGLANADERKAVLDGDGVLPGVSTIYAVTTGIDLVDFDTVIFVGLDWVPSTLLQAEARIHRIGQQRNVTVYFLVGIGTIDEIVRERVIDRLEVFSAAVGGGDEAGLASDLSGESDDDLIASIVQTVRAQMKGKAA